MADETSAARQVLDIVPLVMCVVGAELRRTGHTLATSHFRLLAMLAHRFCSLSELAEQQAVSLPTMSNSVTTLAERGWVRRLPSPHDRRVVLLELTPAGQAVLADMRRQAEARIASLLAPLSQADCETVLAGLAILREVFAPTASETPAYPVAAPPDTNTGESIA